MAVTTLLHYRSFSGLHSCRDCGIHSTLRDGLSNVTCFPSEPISVVDYADYLLY